MDFHPLNGEIAIVAKNPVAEHLMTQVAELDVQTHPSAQLPCDGFQHEFEELILILSFRIFAFTIYPTLRKQIRRDQGSATAKRGKHVGNNGVTSSYNDHIWQLSRCLLDDTEEIGAMEETGTGHVGQFLALGDNAHTQFVVHCDKSNKTF